MCCLTNPDAQRPEIPAWKQREGRSSEREFACNTGEKRTNGPQHVGGAVVFVGQQVGIIFSLGASCRGPAYSRSLVGVDGVSVVTHTTIWSVNDDWRHDDCLRSVLLWILWETEDNNLFISIVFKAEVTRFLFSLLVFLSQMTLNCKKIWNTICLSIFILLNWFKNCTTSVPWTL